MNRPIPIGYIAFVALCLPLLVLLMQAVPGN